MDGDHSIPVGYAFPYYRGLDEVIIHKNGYPLAYQPSCRLGESFSSFLAELKLHHYFPGLDILLWSGIHNVGAFQHYFAGRQRVAVLIQQVFIDFLECQQSRFSYHGKSLVRVIVGFSGCPWYLDDYPACAYIGSDVPVKDACFVKPYLDYALGGIQFILGRFPAVFGDCIKPRVYSAVDVDARYNVIDAGYLHQAEQTSREAAISHSGNQGENEEQLQPVVTFHL